MKKISMLILLILTATNAFAKDVYINVIDVTNSNDKMSSELYKYNGIFNTEEYKAKLYLSEEGERYIIGYVNSNLIVNDLDAIDLDTLRTVDHIILSGDKLNNQSVSKYFLGYGVASDYLIIKGANTSEKHLIQLEKPLGEEDLKRDVRSLISYVLSKKI